MPSQIELTDEEHSLICALRAEGQAPASHLRSEEMTTRRAGRLLEALEERGAVTRVYNGHGRQERPWWWQVAYPKPADYTAPELRKGNIYDWGRPENRVWVELFAGRNQHGLPHVAVKAGENNAVHTVLPAHYFALPIFARRIRGTVTAFSARFSCPTHGECTEDMVRTDKCCSLCGTLLNRH